MGIISRYVKSVWFASQITAAARRLLVTLVAVITCGSASQGPILSAVLVQNDSHASFRSATQYQLWLPLLSSLQPKPIGAYHVHDDELAGAAADYQMNVSLQGLAGIRQGGTQTLELARAAGVKKIVPIYKQSTHGGIGAPFDLSGYKSDIDDIAQYLSDIQSYIDDGTFWMNELVDEPCDPTKWGGVNGIPEADIKAASDYSHLKLPGVLTTIGAGNCIDRSPLKPGDVDIPIIPWTAGKGTIQVYIAQQLGYMQTNGWTNPQVIVNVNGVNPGLLSAADLASTTIYACQQPAVIGVIWYAWHSDTTIDLADWVNPAHPDYQAAVRSAAAACGH
jgi:hypothetical protein